jgi:hypothetical protein
MALIAPTFPILNITHTDVWLVVVLAGFATIMLRMCRMTWPDPSAVQNYAQMANSPGGIILILLGLFVTVFAIVTVFVIWCLVRGIDPQNGLVILLTGLFSGAIGAVSGALFTAMKGVEPHISTSTQETTKTTTLTQEPPPVPPVPPVVASETPTPQGGANP